mgnify:CR=1 FL=1
MENAPIVFLFWSFYFILFIFLFSCLSWNGYIKSQLCSSDYEGVVSVWDAIQSNVVISFDEHDKRAWSVDFALTDPTKIASGSDDAKGFSFFFLFLNFTSDLI